MISHGKKSLTFYDSPFGCNRAASLRKEGIEFGFLDTYHSYQIYGDSAIHLTLENVPLKIIMLNHLEVR